MIVITITVVDISNIKSRNIATMVTALEEVLLAIALEVTVIGVETVTVLVLTVVS